MHASTVLGAATALLLGSSLAAQGIKRVVPASATTADGNTSSWFPYVYDKTRVQHLVDSSAFCRTSALLFEFAYRIDGQMTKALPGLTITGTTVTIGYSPKSSATMSASFAANRTSTQSTVFSGNYNLPPQPIPTNGLGTFNVIYKLPRPYTHAAASGNLLIEFVVPGTATRKREYPLDGVVSGAHVGYRGQPGLFSNNTRTYLSVSSLTNLKPGGSIDLVNRLMRSKYPTLHVLGVSNTKYGSLSLPFDLAPLGAPGNFLHNSMDILVPASLLQSGSTWTASSRVPIPNLSVYGGAVVYATNICWEAQANRLGLVFGRGLSISIGGGAGHGMNLVYAQSSTAATGNFFMRTGKPGGPVLRLRGAFN